MKDSLQFKPKILMGILQANVNAMFGSVEKQIDEKVFYEVIFLPFSTMLILSC